MHAALGRGGDLVRGRLFYGWYIALAGAFTSFLTFGVVGFGFGVFIEPIREETGWSLAAISVGFSLRSFEHGLLAPVTGALVDRLGARRMAIAGVLIVGVGLVLFSQSRVLWVYYLASLVIASGESLGSSTAYSASLMRWFDQKRGQALGLLASARGAGYFMVPVLAVLIGAFGWRPTLLVAAVVIVGCGLPLSLVLRNRPEPYGYRPDGAPAPATPTASQAASSFGEGMTVAEALRTPAFYLLGTATAIGAATQISWIVHQVPHLQNVGFTLQGAALITGAYGLFQVPLRFICGWLGDIVGRRQALRDFLSPAVRRDADLRVAVAVAAVAAAALLPHVPVRARGLGGDVHDAGGRLLRHPLLRHDPWADLDADDAARLRRPGHRRVGVRPDGELPPGVHLLRAVHPQRRDLPAADPAADLERSSPAR